MKAPDLTLFPMPASALDLTPKAHHRAPRGTSEVAAKLIGSIAREQRGEVLAVIVKAGPFGATNAEIEAATGIRAQSVSQRRGELRSLGLIVDSWRRRPTPRGRPAAVWVTPNHAPPGDEPDGGVA